LSVTGNAQVVHKHLWACSKHCCLYN